MKNFFIKNKHILVLIIPVALIYLLFNYEPLPKQINSEEIYLSIKLVLYVILSFFVLFFKKKWKIEIERPKKEISFFYLFGLLIPCFANLIYHFLMPSAGHNEFELLLIFDVIVDVSASVLEDVIFVDLLIALVLNNVNWKHKNLFAILISGGVFTLVHCYTFLNNTWQMSLLLLAWVFLLTLTCGYLAIYFDSFLIPVGVHFLFNATNYVVFNSIYGKIDLDVHYIVFNIVIMLMGFFYVVALWHLSELQAYKKAVEDCHKAKLEDDDSLNDSQL